MGFEMFEIMFFLVWFVILGVFIVNAVQGLSRWNKNNHSPRLTVDAKVIAKRGNTTRHHHNGANGHHYHTYNNTYFVTFEFDSGDRMELQMDGSDFGLLIEGDKGKLTFQGTRFLGFERVWQ